nr:hypothetical protein [Burkholderia ambifaria]
MFERFPELETAVVDRLLKRSMPDQVPESRISYKRLHDFFLEQLKSRGISECEWPFTTRDRARRSLTRYCNAVYLQHRQRWIWARSGTEAAKRSTLGRGYTCLINARRPCSVMQMDFHKVDAASVISVIDENSVEHDYPVARWFIGVLVDEYSGGVLGVSIILESNPSADSALETVASAIAPRSPIDDELRARYTPDGKIVIQDFVCELESQGSTILEVDNAWSNAAVDVVNNLIDVTGCAINFGPVRAWWRRDLIERIFGKLTDHGLKRLPSTYGAGPADPTRTNPVKNAELFRIRLSELMAIIYACVREHNLEPTERLHLVSPVGLLRSAVDHTEHAWLPQPLPRQTRENGSILWHTEHCVVRGNLKQGRSPCIKTDHCRYYGEALAKRYDLVGKTLLVRLNRRDCREAIAIVEETGELLGKLRPEARWARWPYTYQERKIINRAIPIEERETKADPVGAWGREKSAQMLAEKSARARHARSGDALALAKRHRVGKTQSAVDADSLDPHVDFPKAESSLPDVFGLRSCDWIRRSPKGK